MIYNKNKGSKKKMQARREEFICGSTQPNYWKLVTIILVVVLLLLLIESIITTRDILTYGKLTIQRSTMKQILADKQVGVPFILCSIKDKECIRVVRG
jgi:hypothetical protein